MFVALKKIAYLQAHSFMTSKAFLKANKTTYKKYVPFTIQTSNNSNKIKWFTFFESPLIFMFLHSVNSFDDKLCVRFGVYLYVTNDLSVCHRIGDEQNVLMSEAHHITEWWRESGLISFRLNLYNSVGSGLLHLPQMNNMWKGENAICA